MTRVGISRLRLFTSIIYILVLLVNTGRSVSSSSSDNDDKKTTKHPNFVVLLGDNLGYADIGYLMNNQQAKTTSHTPYIDRLARQGLQFEHWNSAAHLCSASRSALLTGRYPVRDGIYPGVFHNNAAAGLSPTTPTIASLLKLQEYGGYATSIVGKWHLGHLPAYLPTAGAGGFDEWLGIPYHMSGGSLDGHVCHRDPHQRMWLPLYHNDTIIQQPVQLAELANRYAKQARQFIERQAARDQPFFLYVPFSHVHQLCAPQNLPEQEYCQWTADPTRLTFDDAVQEMDWIAGQVVRALQETGVANNTLVLFTADNGPWLAEQSCSGKKGKFHGQWLMDNVATPSSNDTCTACPHDYVPSPTATRPHGCVLPKTNLELTGVPCGHDVGLGSMWEANLRMPALAWWPGRIAPGRVSKHTVSTLDVLPTLLALAQRANGGPDKDSTADLVLDGLDISDILWSNNENEDSATPSVENADDRVLFFWRDGFDCGPLGPPYGRFDVVALKIGHLKVWFWTKSGHYNDDPHVYHDPPLVFNVEEDPAEAHALDMPAEFLDHAKRLRQNHMKTISWGPPLTLVQDDAAIPCADPLHNCRRDSANSMPAAVK